VTILGTDVDDNTTVYDTEVVDSSGEITLMTLSPHAHNFVRKAHAGLPYRYKLKPMRLDLVTQSGTAMGSIKKIAEAVISFLNTLKAKYGADTDSLKDIDEFGSTLYTGDVIANLDSGFESEDSILISGNDPMPCTVRSIIPRVEKTGR
jgi:hypothetical protein